ncbi:hypothetical protein EH165_14655 [Nakamurella antarctica]|uniref:Uncharacterized protein n=1 Tax=Nakamurella antarctica TaxID=1902245 RepID=A0A3G8ZYU8_9ACTN|nr:hypothetical protein [Nakamurella antarctica]AZI59196.1 hypothetical protein EH165_14655 [Nakamurella antarctica]
MTDSDSRWLPGQPGISETLENGWRLFAGYRWDAAEFDGGTDLVAIHFITPGTIELEFLVDNGDTYRFLFQSIADLQIDGTFYLEPDVDGWEVFDTWMITAEHPREDGLAVYRLELHTGMVCFASLPGVRLD